MIDPLISPSFPPVMTEHLRQVLMVHPLNRWRSAWRGEGGWADTVISHSVCETPWYRYLLCFLVLLYFTHNKWRPIDRLGQSSSHYFFGHKLCVKQCHHLLSPCGKRIKTLELGVIGKTRPRFFATTKCLMNVWRTCRNRQHEHPRPTADRQKTGTSTENMDERKRSELEDDSLVSLRM